MLAFRRSQELIGISPLTNKLENYDDVSEYAIDDARRDHLLEEGRECSVIWSTSDHWPVGVTHIYVWQGGHFWVACTRERGLDRATRFRKSGCDRVHAAKVDQLRWAQSVIAHAEGQWQPGTVWTEPDDLP
jgi:hypothetical protein